MCRIVQFLPSWQSRHLRVILTGLAVFYWGAFAARSAQLKPSELVDFNRHIKPLLADRCFQCHGSDSQARKARLRLDTEAGAFGAVRSSEGSVFVASDPEASVAWQRISSKDPDFIMPPPESNLSLDADERELIRRWIEQGAEWKAHWAFEPVVKPELPLLGSLPGVNVIRNEVDVFIQSRLEREGLAMSSEADRETLIRRVSFDLTGLPPSLNSIDSFLNDPAPNAFEKVVDRLLSSQAFAERMAMEWMDVARYGDTQGMHGDRERFHWPWRDWVIDAFQSNLPYDQFITWQLAGDLLPDADRDQILATAFHRNHPVSAEGGIIDEEYRVKYVQDRVNTTATAFLGLTMECATCHDHKFDPISQREYYQMSAFFNNMKEIGMVAEGGGSSGPVLLLPTEEESGRLEALEVEENVLMTALRERRRSLSEDRSFESLIRDVPAPAPKPDAFFPLDQWQTRDVAVKGAIHRVVRNTPINKVVDENLSSVASGDPEVVEGRFGNGLRLDREYDLVFLRDVGQFDVHEPFSAGAWVKPEVKGKNQTVMGISGDLTANAWRGWDFFLDLQDRPSLRLIGYWPHNYLQVTSTVSVVPHEWHQVAFTYDGTGRASGVRLFVDGREVDVLVEYDSLYRTIVHPWNAQEGWPQKPVMVGRSGRFYTGENGVFEGSLDHLQLFNRALTAREVFAWWAEDTGDSEPKAAATPAQYLEHYLRRHDSVGMDLIQKLRAVVERRLDGTDSVREIMVLNDMKERRETFVLRRGQYDDPTEVVEVGTPASVLPFGDHLPKNRLGLAQWIVDPKNPLTARVAVNRYWQMVFGSGLVSTPQDFGSQGMLPSHPELLDWLATTFVDSGWDLRQLLRVMVTSATYRQASVATAKHRRVDPQNRLLARGPSHRLPAEMIRDNALAASGLLVRRVGGASVKPYQPDGLWVEKTGPGNRYRHDSGEGLYRRSLYTYVRRTTPHPTMIAFDAPNRSVCVVKRERTNTPLQALALLNDVQFVEAARVLAERMQREGGDLVADQIRYGYRLLCGRTPNDELVSILKGQFETARERFQSDPEAARSLTELGEYPAAASLETNRTAALTLVANTMMNFDESFSKR